VGGFPAHQPFVSPLHSLAFYLSLIRLVLFLFSFFSLLGSAFWLIALFFFCQLDLIGGA